MQFYLKSNKKHGKGVYVFGRQNIEKLKNLKPYLLP